MNPAYLKTSRHLQDYLSGVKKLQPFYSQSLRPDWQKIAAEVSKAFKQKEIVSELIAQNQQSADPEMQKNCQLLKKDNTVIVITGQQLGLMQSPLYIIYKTLSTLWLTDKLNKEDNGYQYVPVFWLEGEDHDFEEVKSLTVHGMSGGLKTIAVDEDTAEQGMSLKSRSLSKDIELVLKELKETLQPTDFQDDLFERLAAIYKPGKNWLEAFKEHMAHIFKNSGLLFFNAGSKKIKKLSVPFFREILQNNREIVDAFVRQSNLLEDGGYQNQVNIQDDKSYLFITKNGPRQSLFLNNDTFYIKETGEKFSQSEILKLLDENPQWFSSTVLSRPLWQSFLLPVVSYVAGAAEISYWGQLKSAFEKMNTVMPHLQPRHSVTLIEPKFDRLLTKYDLAIESVPGSEDTFVKDYFAGTHLGSVTDTLADFEKTIEKNRENVKELIKEIDPTLIKPTEKSYASILDTINKLQNRFSRTISEKEGTIQRHLKSIHESVLPQGTLQERIISPVYFENKYGPDWVEKVYQQFDANFNEHLIVRL